MRAEVEEPLHLKREMGRPLLFEHQSQPNPATSRNALLAVGLWLFLWLGYNSGPEMLMDPRFPTGTADLIQGVRAFFPMLAAWCALLVIFLRANRLFSWIIGPLGLLALYAVAGLASSATLSRDTLYSLYFGGNYFAIILVLLAIVLVDDPLSDLAKVLKFTWGVGIVLTLGLLGAIPLLGTATVIPEQGDPISLRAYGKVSDVLGMPGTRNTGFARYAAISALVALPALLRKGDLAMRVVWGAIFAASMYALIIANGRTETLAFVGGAVMIMAVERGKRTANVLIAIAGAILLGLRGFYSAFYMYITRTGQMDFTFTGRVSTWEDGWHAIESSPWVGLGFQADRIYVGSHMHNALLHAFIQAGILGGCAILAALLITWYYLLKYFIFSPPADRSLVPREIPAVFLFVTISSVMESTFAYFSAAWLLSAPIVAYVMALHMRLRKDRAKVAWEKLLRWRLAQRGIHTVATGRGLQVVVPPVAEGTKLGKPC